MRSMSLEKEATSEAQSLPAGIGFPAWGNTEREMRDSRGVVGYSFARQYIQDALCQSDDVYHLFAQNGSLKPPRQTVYVHSLQQLPYGLRQGWVRAWFQPDENWAAVLRLRTRVGAAVIPMTALTHSISYAYLLETRILPTLLARTYSCDSIICTSETARRALAAMLDHVRDALGGRDHKDFRYRGRLDVIPLGIDTERFSPGDGREARKALDLPEDSIILLYLGRISFSSKCDLLPLLRVMQSVARDCKGTRITLVLAGSDPKGQSALITHYSVVLGLADQTMIFRDPTDEQRLLLYRSANIFISPVDNMQETFGLAVVEAMACGLPTIVSDWNGYRDIVVHGVTGFRAPTYWTQCDEDLSILSDIQPWEHDHLCLSQAVAVDLACVRSSLVLLIQKPGLRREMGTAGRARACSQFSMQAFVSSYHQLLKELSEAVPRETTREGARDYAQAKYCHFFAGHATAMVDEKTGLSITNAGNASTISNLVQLPHVAMTLDKQLLQRVLDIVRLQRTALFGDIVDAAIRGSEWPTAMARRHVMWLVKYGFISVALEMTPATRAVSDARGR